MPNAALLAQAEALRKKQNLDLNNALILAALVNAGIVAQNALFASLSEAQKKQGSALVAKSDEDLRPAGVVYKEHAAKTQPEKPEKSEKQSLAETIYKFLVGFNQGIKDVLKQHNEDVAQMAKDLKKEDVHVFSKDDTIHAYQKAVMEEEAPTVLTYDQTQHVETMTKAANLQAAPVPTGADETVTAIRDLKQRLLDRYLTALVLNDEFKMDSRMVERYVQILDKTERSLEAQVNMKLQQAAPEHQTLLRAFAVDSLQHMQMGERDNYVNGASAVLNQFDTATDAQKAGMTTSALPTLSPRFGGGARKEEEELGYKAPTAPMRPHTPAGGRSGPGLGG